MAKFVITSVLVVAMLLSPGCLDEPSSPSGPSTTEEPDHDEDSRKCPSLIRALGKETCKHPESADVTLTNCAHPDNDFAVPESSVPAQPFTLRDSTAVYIQMHIVSCESGMINNASIGAVAFAIVGPYIDTPAGAPDDAFSSAFAAECVTNNTVFSTWLSMVDITCDAGTISATVSGQTMSSEVIGPGTYETPARAYVPSSTRGFVLNQAFGSPGDGVALTESITGTRIGLSAPSSTTVMGGYLGDLVGGTGVLSGVTSPGSQASVKLTVAPI